MTLGKRPHSSEEENLNISILFDCKPAKISPVKYFFKHFHIVILRPCIMQLKFFIENRRQNRHI